MDEALLEICANTYTAINLHRRLSLLHACFEEVLYHEHAPTKLKEAVLAYALTIASPEDVQAFSEWKDTLWNIFQTHDAVTLLEQLKTQSESLPVLVLYVPVEFDAHALETVGKWSRENISPHILLQIHIEPRTTGGCAFVFNDTYHDYSLHRAFKNHTGVVCDLLNSYA